MHLLVDMHVGNFVRRFLHVFCHFPCGAVSARLRVIDLSCTLSSQQVIIVRTLFLNYPGLQIGCGITTGFLPHTKGEHHWRLGEQSARQRMLQHRHWESEDSSGGRWHHRISC